MCVCVHMCMFVFVCMSPYYIGSVYQMSLILYAMVLHSILISALQIIKSIIHIHRYTNMQSSYTYTHMGHTCTEHIHTNSRDITCEHTAQKPFYIMLYSLYIIDVSHLELVLGCPHIW